MRSLVETHEEGKSETFVQSVRIVCVVCVLLPAQFGCSAHVLHIGCPSDMVAPLPPLSFAVQARAAGVDVLVVSVLDSVHLPVCHKRPSSGLRAFPGVVWLPVVLAW